MFTVCLYSSVCFSLLLHHCFICSSLGRACDVSQLVIASALTVNKRITNDITVIAMDQNCESPNLMVIM